MFQTTNQIITRKMLEIWHYVKSSWMEFVFSGMQSWAIDDGDDRTMGEIGRIMPKNAAEEIKMNVKQLGNRHEKWW